MSRPGSGRRAPRRAVALALAVSLALAGCGPTAPSPSASPGAGTSASPGASGSAAAVATGPPCPSTAAQPSADRPWWSDRVFYEVFVRSFQDSNGDGIGDIRGLIDRLDELNDGDPFTTDDLGVTGLWLMPIAAAASYHGYDVTDYRAVEPDYGTEQDVRDLVAAAHERGIAVVLDEVINHTSRDHPWFQDSMKTGSAPADWYLWSDTKPAVARSDGTPVWHEAPNGRFYYGYFWEGMPDLNLANPDVTREIEGIADFWLGDIGVDGFRLDAAKHLIEDGDQLENTPETHAWLATFSDDVHAAHPEALLLGEVFDSTTISSSYVRDDSLDMTFDFDLGAATIISLNSRDGGSLAAAQREVAEKYPRDTLATFLTNHDQNRVMDQLGDDPVAAKLAAALLLTGPGVPFIYYGEEIGMTGRKPDERIRTPMRWDATAPAAGFSTAEPWEPLSDDAATVNIADESRDDRSIYVAYRELVRVRNDHAGLLTGDLVPLDTSDSGVVAYLRVTAGSTILVIANLAAQAVASPALSLDEGPLCRTDRVPQYLYASVSAPSLTLPTVTSTGGLDGWVPFASLGPREIVVIDLMR